MKIKFLLLLIVMCSCENKPQTFLDLFSNSISKEMVVQDYVPTDSLSMPEAILSDGDYLVFLEPALPQLLTFYDCEKKIFSHGLNKGQGRDEAISVQTIGVGKSAGEVYASDLATQSVFLLSLNNKIKKVRKDSISIDTRFCEVAYDNELAFFLLVGDEKRFLMKANGQYRKIGENIVIPNISPEIVSQTLQGPCTISSEKKRIAWFSVYGDVMEIYDYSDLNNVALVKSHICTLPVFNSSDGSLDFQTKLSVSSVTSDDNYIYALYNERNLEQAAQNRAQAFFSKKVLLFDWNGTPRFIVELDRPIKSITYDKKRNMVLCLGLNNDLEYAVFGFSVDV